MYATWRYISFQTLDTYNLIYLIATINPRVVTYYVLLFFLSYYSNRNRISFTRFRLLYLFLLLVSGPDPLLHCIALGPDLLLLDCFLRGEEVLRFSATLVQCTVLCTLHLLSTLYFLVVIVLPRPDPAPAGPYISVCTRASTSANTSTSSRLVFSLSCSLFFFSIFFLSISRLIFGLMTKCSNYVCT